MTNFRLTLRLFLTAFCLATFIGYMDDETKSLYHLFTAESGGNFLALLLYTIVFTLLAWIFIGLARLVNRVNQKSRLT